MRLATTSLFLLMLAASTAAASTASSTDELLRRGDPREMLTEAKLRADLGRGEEAVALLRAVADAPAPGTVRGEALARLGALLRSLGRHEEALNAFQEVLDEHSDDPDVLHFLAIAVDGVAPAPHVARRGGVRLSVVRTGDVPFAALSWPGQDALRCGLAGTGKHISFALQDTSFGDLFSLFSALGGQELVAAPCLADRTVTLAIDDAPWDRVMAAVVESHDLECKLEGNTVHITCRQDADESARKATKKAMRTVTLAVNAHHQDHGSLPSASVLTTTREIASSVEPFYVVELPRRDAWGGELRYVESGSSFVVLSAGPDGVVEAASSAGVAGGDDLACLVTPSAGPSWPEIACSP